ncbi:unnamed protein product [Rotaria socialis]|uniref:Uncharacterized protein n=1 Tax=Rotaria socialis TaxID=392032 RepID=A0A820A9E3_9BILA|nr:unnamed protein product [Rotaria socialis]CAF3635052.1 unnamed protein product [Rotaria socialis]CAF3699083.1 unnamed protein product [Rotaria socialis]CAF4173099.1 unnamed protein product [Rotaria socialis]CAF4230441.1 unnamed protein product [Rotaria socialis]
MSVSKLESLPNEILTDIFEKYINGLDLLICVNFQQNRRFDELIRRCQRLRFNFIQCHKDDFRFCFGLLPAYIDRIEELAISEENAPGQIYAFLSRHPTFELFTRLRTLYFHFDYNTLDVDYIHTALESLSQLNIHTLSIKAMNIKDNSEFEYEITRLFQLQSLKCLTIKGSWTRMNWDNLEYAESNIEYLAISGIGFRLQDFEYILQFIPHLKYFDCEITNTSYTRHFREIGKKSSKTKDKLKYRLRTLILSLPENSSLTLDMLTTYFNYMPDLHHLEIKTDAELLDADAWKMCFETSLPSLTRFSLRTTTSFANTTNVESVLRSFQNSYWIEKKNFNIIIADHEALAYDYLEVDQIKPPARYKYDQPVTGCWMAPNRTIDNSMVTIDKSINLAIGDKNCISSCPFYYDNVKYLVVANVNLSILSWLTTYVNCSQIKHLSITSTDNRTNILSSLLACVTTVLSLSISFDLIIANSEIFMTTNICVKHLDTSINQHPFNEQDIILLGQCFPYVEHLKIKTSDLFNVPLLKTYVKRLHSLTFEMQQKDQWFGDNYRKQMWEYNLKRELKFFFNIKDSTMTVWIDAAAYEDPYWQRYAKEQSATNSDNKNKKKSRFSFPNFFK